MVTRETLDMDARADLLVHVITSNDFSSLPSRAEQRRGVRADVVLQRCFYAMTCPLAPKSQKGS